MFVALTYIKFKDGSAEAMEIARGTKEECERVADLIPAVAYSGSKTVKEASVVFMGADDWDRQLRSE